MQTDFWLARWRRAETGFHQPRVNPWLEKHLAALRIGQGHHVFVPLCGKAHDLPFLAAQGARVSGCELSPLAVTQFFAEQGLTPTVREVAAGMTLHEAGDIRIFCGDFFCLTPDLLGPVDAVFDRASLVALPPDMRRDYATHLATLATTGARDLLVSFDYPQDEMPGPPFSVPQSEIRALFGAHFDIASLGRADILDQEPRFRERGLSRLTETCWLLQRR
jgi:thiopurine S-methyltransferase